MIVKGASRSSVSFWSQHLLRLDHNERVDVLETALWDEDERQSLHESLQHFQDMARLTARGEKGLYCAHIDPHGDYAMEEEHWHRAANILEEHLGLTAQPRVVVKHTKNGRDHIHVVWMRTKQNEDGRFTLVSDSHNYKNHELAARRMEEAFGHARVKGVFTGRDRDPDTQRCRDARPVAEIGHTEWQRAARLDKDARAVKAQLLALWTAHENGKDYAAALERSGYSLCRGDQKPIHMVVERESGEAYDIRRSMKGVKKKEIEQRLAEYPAQGLETVAEVRERLKEQQRQREEEGRCQARREAMQGQMEKLRRSQRRRPRPARQAPKRNTDTRQGRAEGDTRKPLTRMLERIQEARTRRETARQQEQAQRADRQARYEGRRDQFLGQMAKMRGQRQQRDMAAGWMERAERTGFYDRDAQTTAEQERIHAAGMEHARAEEERNRLERREVHLNKARAALQSYQEGQRWAYGNEAQSRRMEHGQMIRAQYGDDLRRKQDELARLRMREAEGGTLYRVRHGRGDRERMAVLMKEIENTRQRMEEANARFTRAEGERRDGFEQARRREQEALDRQVFRMSRLPAYLDPERQETGWEAELERRGGPKNLALYNFW